MPQPKEEHFIPMKFPIHLLLFLSTLGAAVAAGPGKATPDALIGTLLANNPQLRALEAEWKSARHEAVIAGALPDPMFAFGHFVSSPETRVGPQQDKIGLSQKFPWFGKLSTARQAAAREAGAQELLWRAAGEELALRTALAYIDVANSRDSLELIDRQITVTEELQKAAERIYGSASQRAGQEDILRFSVLANRMRDRTIALKEREKLALDAIDRLLDMEIARNATFSVSAALRARRPIPPDPRTRFASAYGLRPEILAAELRLDARQLRTRLAKLDYFPDITLGADYIVVGQANEMNGRRPADSGKDAAMVYLAFNLPIWWGKQDAQLQSARELERAQAGRIDDLRAAIRREILEAYRNAEAADASVTLHREKLVPEAIRARELAMAEYGAGRQNFLNALDAENTVLDLQLKQVDAEANAARAKWKLFRALGMASLTGAQRTSNPTSYSK